MKRCACRYHRASHFMTDTRSKTKANSTVLLNRHWRDSSSINAITINDDTDNDMQTVLNAVRDVAAKSPAKSPWKDEMDFSSNEDLNVLLRTPVKPIITKRSVTTGRIARKNATNKNLMERSIQRSNQDQRVKFSPVGKTKKYHWSGTFHSKRNLFSKDKYSDMLYSPCDNEPNKLNDQLTNYNYYNEDFEKRKPTSKGDIFYSNEFDSQTDGDLRKNEWIDDNIDYQSYMDICTNGCTEFDHFKNYIEQNNGALPIASNVNINLRRIPDVDNKNKKMCSINLRTNERDNATILYSQLTYNINNINKEECSNLCSAKESIDSSNIELNTRKIINDTKKKSAVRSCCYKAWCLLMSILKNAILFLWLPVAYIIFFIYIQKREDREKQCNI